MKPKPHEKLREVVVIVAEEVVEFIKKNMTKSMTVVAVV